jgi:hypothetical protein
VTAFGTVSDIFYGDPGLISKDVESTRGTSAKAVVPSRKA